MGQFFFVFHLKEQIRARQAGVRGTRVYKRLGRSPGRGNISERITGASGVNLAGIVVQPF